MNKEQWTEILVGEAQIRLKEAVLETGGAFVSDKSRFEELLDKVVKCGDVLFEGIFEVRASNRKARFLSSPTCRGLASKLH